MGAGIQDGVGVQAVFAVEVWNIGAFAEVFGAEGDHALAADGAEPGVGGRVAVQDCDEGGVSGEGGEDGFDVGAGGSVAFAAGAGGGGPAGVEAVGAGDGEEAGAGGFGQEFGEGGFGFRRDGALVGQGDAGAGGGGGDPVGAGDDVGGVQGAGFLFQGAG